MEIHEVLEEEAAMNSVLDTLVQRTLRKPLGVSLISDLLW